MPTAPSRHPHLAVTARCGQGDVDVEAAAVRRPSAAAGAAGICSHDLQRGPPASSVWMHIDHRISKRVRKLSYDIRPRVFWDFSLRHRLFPPFLINSRCPEPLSAPLTHATRASGVPSKIQRTLGIPISTPARALLPLIDSSHCLSLMMASRLLAIAWPLATTLRV